MILRTQSRKTRKCRLFPQNPFPISETSTVHFSESSEASPLTTHLHLCLTLPPSLLPNWRSCPTSHSCDSVSTDSASRGPASPSLTTTNSQQHLHFHSFILLSTASSSSLLDSTEECRSVCCPAPGCALFQSRLFKVADDAAILGDKCNQATPHFQSVCGPSGACPSLPGCTAWPWHPLNGAPHPLV